jgi:hypothetical protein
MPNKENIRDHDLDTIRRGTGLWNAPFLRGAGTTRIRSIFMYVSDWAAARAQRIWLFQEPFSSCSHAGACAAGSLRAYTQGRVLLGRVLLVLCYTTPTGLYLRYGSTSFNVSSSL